jgi:hypothetical protein
MIIFGTSQPSLRYLLYCFSAAYGGHFFSARLSKDIKISTSQKAHFKGLIITSNIARFESFLQVSKALDQLNKFSNFFFEIIRLARCENSVIILQAISKVITTSSSVI